MNGAEWNGWPCSADRTMAGPYIIAKKVVGAAAVDWGMARNNTH